MLLLCYDISRAFVFVTPFSFRVLLGFGRRGPAFILIALQKSRRTRRAILRLAPTLAVIVQLNLVRRVIFRSPRRVSIPQRDYCSRRPSVFAYPDATFSPPRLRRIATLRPEGPSPSASSGPGATLVRGPLQVFSASIQPSMYSTGGICSSRISFVTCTASNGRPKTICNVFSLWRLKRSERRERTGQRESWKEKKE